MISPTQRPLPDITQHSHQTDIHAPGGIRTRNPSKREAADPRLRPRGHRDQLTSTIIPIKSYEMDELTSTELKFTLEHAMKTWGYSSTLSLTSTLDEDRIGGPQHAPATLRPGNESR